MARLVAVCTSPYFDASKCTRGGVHLIIAQYSTVWIVYVTSGYPALRQKKRGPRAPVEIILDL